MNRLQIIFSIILFFYHSIILTAEESTKRIELHEDKKLDKEELAQKREGFYFNALPLFSSDPVRGQGGGLRTNFFLMEKKQMNISNTSHTNIK